MLRPVLTAVVLTLLTLLTLLPLGASGPARAQPATENARLADEAARRAQEAAESAQRAETMEEEVRLAGERIAALSADADAKEAELRRLRTDLADLAAREAAAREALRQNRDYYAATLNAMIALSKTPEAALFAHSGRPLDMARSWTVVADLKTTLISQAAAVRQSLADLEALRTEGAAARAAAEEGIAALRSEERELQRLIEERRVQTEDALTRAAASQREAEMLRGRLDELSRIARTAPRPILRGNRRPAYVAQAPGGPGGPGGAPGGGPGQNPAPPGRGPAGPQRNPFSPLEPLSNARGRMTPPVSGRPLIAFGGDLPGGGRSEGILYQAAARARVFAPWGGRVVYAGPLQTFGLVVVIDVGDNTQIVLAGLGDTHLRVNDLVLHGDVAGRLGGPRPVGDGRTTTNVASLYLELRQNGRPINPQAWLAQ